MDSERKRMTPNSSKTGVVIGSVWESRMRGSFKVFNGDDKNQELDKPTEKSNQIVTSGETQKVNLRSKPSSNAVGGWGKRKTWKSDGDLKGNEKSPVQISKGRSDNKKVLGELSKVQSVSIDGSERNPVQRSIKTRFLSRKGSEGRDLGDGIEKVKSITSQETSISDECNHPIERGNELDVCEEKLMTDDFVKDFVKVKALNDEDDEEDCKKATMEESEEVNEERAIVVVKEMEVMEPISTAQKKKSSDVVIEDKNIHHRNERSNPISRTVRKQPSPVVNHPRIISKPNEFQSQRVPKSHSKLQSLIDLIMWRDVSKSSLIFGLGTFSILSSSYTQELNISFISVISYLSLIYLAATFIFKSFISRGFVETESSVTDDEEYVLGEEEAIWALKLFLPYINEFLLRVKSLFSGDPTTTIKMAVLLFILARCGSSITIWKMAKLAFFGVFTVPRICSSYSSILSAYGAFWIQRFKDAWDSCTQKKAVAFGVFTLVWNLSSIIARVWAVFMLLVAFKCYQQSMTKDEVVQDQEEVEEEQQPVTSRRQSSWQDQRNERFLASTGSAKLKKRS